MAATGGGSRSAPAPKPLASVEQTLQGRHGIYDMKVTNQKGEVVAMFRGKSAVIPGQVFPEEASA